MKGRKPKPTRLKLLEGNPGHRPLPEDEPQPPANIPDCPDHLDKEARVEWRRMAKELEPLGLLTNLDKAVFAMYCEAFSTWAKATKMIQEKGMVFSTTGKTTTKTLKDGTIKTETTGGGYPIMNPYFSIANKAKEQMMKCLIELGWTPSSRSRVKVLKVKEPKDERERFFK